MAAYLISVACLLYLAGLQTGGAFGYPTDDTYVHMAIAKNLVRHGVWGVTRHETSSSTSSPLWTLMIAASYRVFGINEWSPFFLALLSGISLIIACHSYLVPKIRNGTILAIAVAFIAFATPVPALTILGMEHVFHAVITLIFAVTSAALVASRALNPAPRTLSMLCLLAFLLAGIRYEGLFLVFVVCLLLSLKRKFGPALLIGVCGLLIPLGYGVWSISKGLSFLPNSLLVKARMPQLTLGYVKASPVFLERVFHHTPEVALLFAGLAISLVLASLRERGKSWRDGDYLVLITLSTLLLHAQFASFGWFYRYEAYLISLGLLALIRTVPDLAPFFSGTGRLPVLRAAGVGITGWLLLYPLALRGIASFDLTPHAVRNIHQQQYQIGLFLKRYYADQRVAANDIGAICFLSDVRLFDVYGIGTLEVARLRSERQYTAARLLDMIARHDVRISIIYEDWFRFGPLNGLTAKWDKAGQWRIPDNRICGADTVSFYSVRPGDEAPLLQNLYRFAPSLPAAVQQEGQYLLPDGVQGRVRTEGIDNVDSKTRRSPARLSGLFGWLLAFGNFCSTLPTRLDP